MKHYYSLIFLLFTVLSFSQVPTGYYDSAAGSGYTLKTQLKQIIDNTNDGLTTEYLSVDNGYGGLYTTYSTSDTDSYYENNGTVLDMYSEMVDEDGNNLLDNYEYTYEVEDPDDRDPGSGGTSEGEYYNREHLIPQSVFDSNYPMRSDAHFVVPSDKYVNSQRGSYPFGVVDTPNWTSTNGSKRGNNLDSDYSAGYTETVFEPIDEFKGDIARMFFYFAARYEDDVASWSYEMFNGTSDQVFDLTFFNILHQWHLDDPVSTRETYRNDAIFVRQNNRNPFIDHPEYIASIWNSVLSTNENDFLKSISIFPNPIKDNYLNIRTNTALKIEIFNVLGKRVISDEVNSNKNYLNLSDLNSGIYLIKISNGNQTITKKLIRQ